MIDTAPTPDTKIQYAVTALKFIKEVQMVDGTVSGILRYYFCNKAVDCTLLYL
jgi:hypothetical protein